MDRADAESKVKYGSVWEYYVCRKTKDGRDISSREPVSITVVGSEVPM